MAICGICGESAAFLDVHAECDALLKEGKTRAQIAAIRSPADGALNVNEIRAVADRLVTMGALLCVVLTVAGGVGSMLWNSSGDGVGMAFCFVVGAAGGAFLGSVVFTWLKLQALVARKLAGE